MNPVMPTVGGAFDPQADKCILQFECLHSSILHYMQTRAPCSHRGGHRFESCWTHHKRKSLKIKDLHLFPSSTGVQNLSARALFVRCKRFAPPMKLFPIMINLCEESRETITRTHFITYDSMKPPDSATMAQNDVLKSIRCVFRVKEKGPSMLEKPYLKLLLGLLPNNWFVSNRVT